ncbi:Nucleolar GTP-binding protein 2 [Desmophyllum pertusum]|uniref:Nucleolar GTP-binding protein 2 n=1 Tax=Desmophyllum pertusum TaxID=174260 RepID=A0A9X0CUG4_9CNID|nr:Nucleolar GTP-binding protein 2 [Desmophyllum pertusum]
MKDLMEAALLSSEVYDEEKDTNIVREDDGENYKNHCLQKGNQKEIWNELYKVIDSSDVVIQVIDARDPMGTRSSHIESFMKKEKQHKHLIFCSEQLHTDKKQISVGVIGYPNVGKSSIINTLRAKRCGMVTRDTDIILKARGSCGECQRCGLSHSVVLERVKREYITKTYKITSWSDPTDFLEQVAQRTGKTTQGWRSRRQHNGENTEQLAQKSKNVNLHVKQDFGAINVGLEYTGDDVQPLEENSEGEEDLSLDSESESEDENEDGDKGDENVQDEERSDDISGRLMENRVSIHKVARTGRNRNNNFATLRHISQ